MKAYIEHFLTAGNPARNKLDDNQELYYPTICRAIAKNDYDGYIWQEFTPLGGLVTAQKQAFKAFDV